MIKENDVEQVQNIIKRLAEISCDLKEISAKQEILISEGEQLELLLKEMGAIK